MLTVGNNEYILTLLKFISSMPPCVEEVKYTVGIQGYLQLTVRKFYAVVLQGWISTMDILSVIYCGHTFTQS